MNAFKLAYDYLPGDLPNASSYWSGVPNGNGNGRIQEVPNSGNSHAGEYILAWEHLGQNGAKLLPYLYDSVWAGGPVGGTFDKTERDKALPFSKVGYHWGIHRRNVYKTHQYVLGAYDSLNGGYGVTNSLSPKSAFSIDSKIDDGKPATGNVRVEGITPWFGIQIIQSAGGNPFNPTYTQTPTAGNCTASGAVAYDNTAQYNAAFEDISCLPIFISATK